MRYWLALRGIVMILLALAGAEGLVWLVLNFTSGEMIAPQPKTVAVEFSAALTAQQWDGALDLLSEDLRRQVKEEDLRQLAQQIEAKHPHIERVNEVSEEKQGDSATAVTGFIFTGQERAEVAYALVRENHLWKIASLDELRAFASAP